MRMTVEQVEFNRGGRFGITVIKMNSFRMYIHKQNCNNMLLNCDQIYIKKVFMFKTHYNFILT